MAAGCVAIQHSQGCDTATAVSTILPGRPATRRGMPATRPVLRHDTAQCARGQGAVRAAWAHHARSLGLLGVHLCTQLSFGLSALFLVTVWTTVHEHYSQDFKKKLK